MKCIDQSTYKEMKSLGLLNPEVIKDENGIPIRVRDKETGRYKTVVNIKCQIANRHKKSSAKSYFVEEPIYKDYLEIIKKSKSK